MTVRWSVRSWCLALACLLTSAALAADAAGVDLHRLWDDRCADCHGLAGSDAPFFVQLLECVQRETGRP